MAQEHILSINNLSFCYGKKTILKDLNLSVRKGEIIALTGLNGTGKTTLLSILATILRPESGSVIYDGCNIFGNRIKEYRTKISYIPQDISLYQSLSGLDNLNFWAGLYSLKGRVKKERIKEALKFSGLEDHKHRRVELYSGGMKRRLNIAVSLLHHPQLILMDEPLSGVDVVSKDHIINAVKNLKRSGCTIIIATHSEDEINRLCDRTAVLRNHSNPGAQIYCTR